ncbi:sulfite exporter TauE/SafE family protein [Actinopolyspora halophila]|uniref:sulfite exporter TauE/SafE family protein n=1 Tax=Actinopolyspora halophila TaxID=1850 RepID=UPI0003720AB9|nr:sulfite exporter TauE/SafE family protein [Actinopolyspora halophila]
MAGLSLPVLVLLGLFGLAGGIGITAVGPGGVLPTIGLFVLTGLPPAGVAGTSIVTHIGTGALATAACTRSGHLREPRTLRIAVNLSAAAVIGTPLGILVNTAVSGAAFGILLAVAVAVTGILVWVREHRARGSDEAPKHVSPLLTSTVGLVVATAGGMFGIGGPMLSVPLLVLCGLPVLPALAAAQAQSVVIAGIGTFGYLAHGTVDWPLAVLVGVPELVGVLLGWKIAQAVPAHRLKYALATALLLIAPYLALHT